MVLCCGVVDWEVSGVVVWARSSVLGDEWWCCFVDGSMTGVAVLLKVAGVVGC